MSFRIKRYAGGAVAIFILAAILTKQATAQESADQEFSRAMEIIDQEPSQVNQAIGLLKLSAEKGNIEAAYNLGVALYHDNKIPEAIKWFEQASQAGDVRAKFNMATIYEENKALSASPHSIVALYSAAAEGGIVQAMHRFGIVTFTGQYDDLDPVKGLAWLLLAEKYEDDDVKEDLARCVQLLSIEQQEMAQEMAEKLRTRLEQNPEFLNNMSL